MFPSCYLFQVAPDMTGHNTKTTKATLKDLCADDKKRVANLIKELARYCVLYGV